MYHIIALLRLPRLIVIAHRSDSVMSFQTDQRAGVGLPPLIIPGTGISLKNPDISISLVLG